MFNRAFNIFYKKKKIKKKINDLIPKTMTFILIFTTNGPSIIKRIRYTIFCNYFYF